MKYQRDRLSLFLSLSHHTNRDKISIWCAFFHFANVITKCHPLMNVTSIRMARMSDESRNQITSKYSVCIFLVTAPLDASGVACCKFSHRRSCRANPFGHDPTTTGGLPVRYILRADGRRIISCITNARPRTPCRRIENRILIPSRTWAAAASRAGGSFRYEWPFCIRSPKCTFDARPCLLSYPLYLYSRVRCAERPSWSVLQPVRNRKICMWHLYFQSYLVEKERWTKSKDFTFRGFPPCPDPFLECQTRETQNLYIESTRGSLKNMN